MTKARELSELAHLTSVSGTTATVDGTIVATTFTGDGSSLTGVGTFNPTSVTGATPSLNVGTFNFFDQGTLTANTTVSFASVPTNANWKYSYKGTDLGAGNVSAASYANKSFALGAGIAEPQGVFFKPDGTMMFIADAGNDYIYEFALSVAWNVTSATYVRDFSMYNQQQSPTGISFKSDGTKVFIAGNNPPRVTEYGIGTAWNIAAIFSVTNFSLSSQDTDPQGLFFKPDGYKMYMVGQTNNKVYEYNLSTAWSISTAVYYQSFSVLAQESLSSSLHFDPTGTKMYVMGKAGDDINQYTLSTAWDVTTAVYSQVFSVSSEDSEPSGLFIRADGIKMYMTGYSTDKVYEYNVGSPTTITLPSSVVGTVTAADAGKRVTYEFFTLDGGTTVNLISEEII
tara:strand:+ start:1 stop:1194 length:1194 start_codon:yes stop_codon:yes gene_type:complete